MGETSSGDRMDPQLLAILRCPVTRSPLRQEGAFLVSERGGLRYPIRDGIPVLLPEEAIVPAPFRNLEEFKSRYCGKSVCDADSGNGRHV